MVDFVVDPFFQNHPSYLESFSFSELRGQISEQPGTHCKRGALTDSSGIRLFPCGLQANSLFNDTFSLWDNETGDPLHLDRSGVAWESDLRRFDNPPGYPDQPQNLSWLFQRFPTVIPKLAGTRTDALAVWLRPAATPRVQKPYAILRDRLQAGQVIDIDIDANFPVSKIGAKKMLLLTTSGTLGGPSTDFGKFLLAAGVICWVAALTIVAIRLCCGRQIGEGRRRCIAVYVAGEHGSGKGCTQDPDPSPAHLA